MTVADVIAAVLLVGMTAYAVLGGADFGGGVWDLLAAGPRKRGQRALIAAAMGPVWEANHVWLIFVIVGLFTAFPTVFAVLGVALYVPFTIALLGIVLRGAAFAFRAHGREATRELSPWAVVFGAASIMTPAALGASVAAVASGAIRAPGGRLVSHIASGWTTLLALDVALLGVALCAYLAATYLMVEAGTDLALQADFRRRAVGAAVVSGALALGGLLLARWQAPSLWSALSGRGLPLVGLALGDGVVALLAVWRWPPAIARIPVAGLMTLVLWAWAVGQWPYLVPPDLTIAGTAAPESSLNALLIILVAGAALVGPSLLLLFWVFKGRNPAGSETAASQRSP